MGFFSSQCAKTATSLGGIPNPNQYGPQADTGQVGPAPAQSTAINTAIDDLLLRQGAVTDHHHP
ncbi:hypothetical protein GCM10009632_57090 [Mycolicibacterium alvei]